MIHLLECKVLTHIAPKINSKIRYENLFGSSSELIEVAETLFRICQERDKILNILKYNVNFIQVLYLYDPGAPKVSSESLCSCSNTNFINYVIVWM